MFELPCSWPIPGELGISTSARGVPLQSQGWAREFKRSSKRGQFSFFCCCLRCQVLTLLQDHVGKQAAAAAKKRISGLGPCLVPHVRCQLSSVDSGAALGFCCLSSGRHRLTATVLLLVCGTDRNRTGQLLPFTQPGWRFCNFFILITAI